ncbi:XdhC family protein [Candidatus Gracilibacteria bacterium]|nr:XdhC family protein [Candidatus Gracilibacteria bacterium]
MISEILPDIDRWLARGDSVAIATVVKTMGSSPRQVGAKMAVSSTGSIAGSVSGGCIEGAVFEACQDVIASGRARLLHFGVADETAWEVGLACGGTIDVFVEPLR